MFPSSGNSTLEVLRRVFGDAGDVIEIGSGTGQHAVWFAAGLPHLVWRTSDLPRNHAGIEAWIDEAGLANVERPLALDVVRRPWPVTTAGGAFSANTAHIMHWPEVEAPRRGAAAGRTIRALRPLRPRRPPHQREQRRVRSIATGRGPGHGGA